MAKAPKPATTADASVRMLETVEHDGTLYGPGEEARMTVAQAESLVGLGVAEIVSKDAVSST